MATEEEEIYVGAIGFGIVLATGQDLDSSTKWEIHVLKPSGVEATWTAAKHATAGSIAYTTVSGDLDTAGVYQLQSYVEWGTAKFLGETVDLIVLPKYARFEED
jgi:hypothetical protein